MKVMQSVGTYWMIRHKPTGGFLPELAKPVRGGYTHTDPCTAESMQGTPRLFTTERGAKNALTWWLRGATTVHITSADWGSFMPEPEEDWNTDKRPERKAEDMIVVKVDLSEVVEEIT